MKKLIIILIALFAISFTAPAKGYKSSKKHTTVKRMTKRQVKNAQKGKNLYHYKHHKIRKRRF